MTVQELISRVARFLRRYNDFDVSQMCGLTAGTITATLQTTNPFEYFLYNQQISFNPDGTGMSQTKNNIAMTACVQQVISSFCYYLVSINISGAITVTKGTDNNYGLPTTPFGNVPIGALLINTDASHTFTSGTTGLASTGITTQFFDIDCGVALSLIQEVQRKLERGIKVPFNNQVVRVSNFDHMIAHVQVALTPGQYLVVNPFPTYKALISANIIDSNGYMWPDLDRTEFNSAMRSYPSFTQNLQRPLMISRLPAIQTVLIPETVDTVNFLLRPSADQAYTLDMQAYQFTPALDGVVYSSNFWTQVAPEILLYGALADAGAYFIINQERIEEWKGKYADAVAGLSSSQKNEKYSGSLLNIVNNNPLVTGNYDIYSDSYGGLP